MKTNKLRKFVDFVLPRLPSEVPLFGQVHTNRHLFHRTTSEIFRDPMRSGATCSSPTNLWITPSLDTSNAPLITVFNHYKALFSPTALYHSDQFQDK